MAVFETLIQNLQGIGFFQYFMPFLFIMAVVYGILQKIELFEDETVDATVAIITSFLAILGIYMFVGAQFFPQFFGVLTVALFIILGYVIILGMMGVDIQEVANMDDASKQRTAIYGAVVLALVLMGVLHLAGFLNAVQTLTSDEALAFFTFVLLIVAIRRITE